MVAVPNLNQLSGAEKDALILALLERLEVAERRIAELEAKLNEPPKTPDNSSVPPSRGAKSNTKNRVTRRERRDGPGTARRLAVAPDRTVSFKASQCPHCGTGLDPDAQTVRAVYDRIEVPEIRPHVTRVHLFGGTCPCCASAFTAATEPGLEPGSPFGRSVEALVIYLHAVHAISFQRLSRLLDEVFGLPVSEGAIANILARSQKPFLDQAETITEHVRRAEVIGCDETSARVAGRTHWEWVFVTALCVLHIVRPRRAKAVIREILAGHVPRVWVSDRYGAQQGHGADWQVCLAHFLRDIQYALDAGDDLFARAAQAPDPACAGDRPAAAGPQGQHAPSLPGRSGPAPRRAHEVGAGTLPGSQTAPSHGQNPSASVRLRHRPRRAADQQRCRTGAAAQRHLPQGHLRFPLVVGR